MTTSNTFLRDDAQFVGASSGGPRYVLTGDTTFYVATNGSDSSDGTTTGMAWATFAHARSILGGQLDFGGNIVTLQAVSGHASFTEQFLCFNWVGGGSFVLDINSGSIATTGQDAIKCLVDLPGSVTIKNVTLSTATGGNAACIAHAGQGSIIVGSGVTFGASVLFHMVASGGGAAIKFSAPYTITGDAPRHMSTFVNALIIGFANPSTPTGQTVTINGARTFATAFATADGASNLTMNGMNYIFSGGGSATTPSNARAIVTGNAIIYTAGGGGTFFPGTGNTPGFTAGSGGIYQ